MGMGRLGMGRLSRGLGVAKGLLVFQILLRMCGRLAFNAAFDILLDSPMSRMGSGNAMGSEAPPLARTPLPSTPTG